MRFHFDKGTSKQLTKSEPQAGIGFEEAQEIFLHPCHVERAGVLEQYRAIGWARERLFPLIFEVREDKEGEDYHLVTLWRAIGQKQQLYEEHW